MYTTEVEDHISLFGKEFFLQQRPGATSVTPYVVQGSRASVRQYKDAQGSRWALKVFTAKYQDPDLLHSVERLKGLAAQRGLAAAYRLIVEPQDPLVTVNPDLKYALLMPWVDGISWADLLVKARNQELNWPLALAGPLCMRFLNIMRMLEGRGCAHTDIAPGNVMLAYSSNLDVQLIDLEDMYQPGLPVPHYPNTGEEGYAHPSHASCFCPEGDRFASAILAAEILVMSNPQLAWRAGSNGYFQGDYKQDRFNEAYPWLCSVAPRFAEQFARAWKAGALQDCPTLGTLAESLRLDGILDSEDTSLKPADPAARHFSRAIDLPNSSLAQSLGLYDIAEVKDSTARVPADQTLILPSAPRNGLRADTPNHDGAETPARHRETPAEMKPVLVNRAAPVVNPNKPVWRIGAVMALGAAALLIAGYFLWNKVHSKSTQTMALAAVKNTSAAEPFGTGTGSDGVTLRHYGIAILAETRPFVFSSAQTKTKTTWTPQERARRLAFRLNDNLGDVTELISKGVSVDDAVKNVLVGRLNGTYIIYFKYGKAEGDKMGDVIFTVDSATARDCHSDPQTLAYWWRDLLRDHLLITLGQAPLYPADTEDRPHPPAALVDLYYRLKEADGGKAPDEAAFHKVEADLLDHNLNDDLENLYRNVPENYHPLHDPDTKLNLRQEDSTE